MVLAYIYYIHNLTSQYPYSNEMGLRYYCRNIAESAKGPFLPEATAK